MIGIRRRGQTGAAALELALFLPLLMALAALVGPAAVALKEQTDISRAAGSAARFATETPDSIRRDCDGVRMVNGRRPSAEQVEREVECELFGVDGTPPAGFSVEVSPDPGLAQPGDEVTVTVSREIDLGIFGSALGRPTATLTATSVAIEE